MYKAGFSTLKKQWRYTSRKQTESDISALERSHFGAVHSPSPRARQSTDQKMIRALGGHARSGQTDDTASKSVSRFLLAPKFIFLPFFNADTVQRASARQERRQRAAKGEKGEKPRTKRHSGPRFQRAQPHSLEAGDLPFLCFFVSVLAAILRKRGLACCSIREILRNARKKEGMRMAPPLALLRALAALSGSVDADARAKRTT